MTLDRQLRDILSDEQRLPSDPESAISGTELLTLVRPRLQGEYSENSLRQYFSSLAADPTSPLARAEGRYGYYRRPTSQRAPVVEVQNDQPAQAGEPLPNEGREGTEIGREGQLEEKFRAFYLRYVRLENQFPVRIEHVAAQRRRAGVNKWKFPDAIVLAWDVGESTEAGFSLDRATLDVKRGLGEQPFKLSSVELKVELSLGSFREFFFQCVSNSMWAHFAKLIIACPVSDALLGNELRRLGASYGVGISYFGFSRSTLEALPTATEILSMSDDNFESLANGQNEATLTPGVAKSALDWEHIKDLRAQSAEFSDVFGWIARCLRDSRAYTFDSYRNLVQIENEAG